jgi:hypothetical protein
MVRLDWQASQDWRVNGKWLHTAGTSRNPYPGAGIGFGTNMPLFGQYDACPCNRQYTVSTTGVLSNTLVAELAFGSAHRPLSTEPLNPDLLSRSGTGLANFPLLFPGAVKLDLVPSFVFSGPGSRVANPPTNQTQFAPFQQYNTVYDVVGNLTKVQRSHTLKTGVFFQRSIKVQSGRQAANGVVTFVNDASNPLDTGYPFANAALGVYQSYTQANSWLQGHYVYDNIEWLAQDTWRATPRLSLDYGMRFYLVQPLYETGGLSSNFLPDRFDASKAPRLYYPGRDAAGNRAAVDRATGATVAAFNIGRIVPGSGSLVGNGLFQAGQGIDEKLYDDRGVHYSPRVGVAYDVLGTQEIVIRGGAGIFYDRPSGDPVYVMLEQLPTVTQPSLLYGRLQDVGSAVGGPEAPPAKIAAFDVAGKVPTVYTYNVGVQLATPWSSMLDVSYVGSKSRNLHTQVNINAPAYGVAYRPENQDPTLPPSAVPGATALPVDLLRPYRGFGDILQMRQDAYADYNSLQTSWRRRFTRGFSFGLSYVLGRAMGSTPANDLVAGIFPNPSVLGMPRTDSAENQRTANYMPLNTDRRHGVQSNFVWQLPNASVNNRFLAGLTHDWQISGVYRAESGSPYTVGYNIPGVSPYTLTGTQRNESARIVITGDPGSGYSDDPYQQFNPAAFTTPTAGSIGLESGRNYLNYEPLRTLDLSVARFLRFGASRRLELRVDAFNALNAAIITGVNATLQVRGLTDSTPTNLSRDASGNLVNPSGFGAVTAVAPARQIQVMARFHFSSAQTSRSNDAITSSGATGHGRCAAARHRIRCRRTAAGGGRPCRVHHDRPGGRDGAIRPLRTRAVVRPRHRAGRRRHAGGADQRRRRRAGEWPGEGGGGAQDSARARDHLGHAHAQREPHGRVARYACRRAAARAGGRLVLAPRSFRGGGRASGGRAPATGTRRVRHR